MADYGTQIGAFPNDNGGSRYSRPEVMRKILKGREHLGLTHPYFPTTEKGLSLSKSPGTV